MSTSGKSFVSASLSWYNVKVFSKPETSMFASKPTKEAVEIIKNVSGEVSAGTCLAIMGSSGAGKTTLLNVLTARNLSNFKVDGCVKINGEVADAAKITTMSAYVQQQDLFIATLSVREHLIFQAMVRMDASVSDDNKVARVCEVIQELSLEKCADTLVGGTQATGKGISGGEMKRLAFAVEILTNPSIMFCDEPTSGLDSFMAGNLVSQLNKMAAAGRTIICTIHQPSSDVFNLFSNLLLMADGHVAYMGETKGALGYFERLGHKCPTNFNPADFYLHELAVKPGLEVECKAKINRICTYYKSTQPTVEVPHRNSFAKEKSTSSPYKVSCWAQYQALAWRSLLIVLREPMLTNVRLTQAMITAIVLGIFFNGQHFDQPGVTNANAVLFLYLINVSVNNAFCVVNVFCSELPVFMREHNAGMYRVDPYFVCKNLAEMPIFVFIPILYATTFYFLVGLYPSFDAYLYLVVVGIFVSAVGVSYGYLISCLCNNTDLALSAGPPILIPLQLLGGYYINSKSIPPYLSWAQFLSWFYYGYDLAINNQWTNVDYIDCTRGGSSINGSSLANTTTTTSSIFTTPMPTVASKLGGMCLATGQEVVEFLDMNHNRQALDFGLLVVLFFILRGSSYMALYVRAMYSR